VDNKQTCDSYTAIDVKDLLEIDELQPGVVYLEEGHNGKPWLAAFLCPCGCGEACHCIIRGMVQGHTGPSWTLTNNDSGVTLFPSVHRIPERTCGAHFFLENGRIKWC